MRATRPQTPARDNVPWPLSLMEIGGFINKQAGQVCVERISCPIFTLYSFFIQRVHGMPIYKKHTLKGDAQAPPFSFYLE